MTDHETHTIRNVWMTSRYFPHMIHNHPYHRIYICMLESLLHSLYYQGMYPLKFRAYKTDEKVMLDNITIMQTAWNKDGVSLLYNILHGDMYIPMLFTQKKDKKNKEVYEWDIVLVEWYVDGFISPKNTAVVEYHDRECAFWYYDTWWGFQNLWYAKIEIIGNIREHPHLLPYSQVIPWAEHWD